MCFTLSAVQGLVVKSRRGLQHHKVPFAHDCKSYADLLATVAAIKPTALIGVSTVAGAFTKEVLAAMATMNEMPIVFPLSNPTQLSECTFEDALKATDGRVLFASGSPFDPVTWRGEERHAAQANNAYIFPAVGHAAVLACAKCIDDKTFLIAANVLANLTSVEDLRRGWLFPQFDGILKASKAIMVACCEHFVAAGLGEKAGDASWQHIVDRSIWGPQLLSRL